MELGDVLFAATDGLLETRRAGAFFGDDRLSELLSQHGRTTPPQQLAELVYAAAQEWAPVLHDDVVVLVLRRAPEIELRDEPASSPAARALYAEYQALVRERLGPDFQPTEEIFATERAFEGTRAGFVVLYARGLPVACGGLRSLGTGAEPRSSACSSPRARATRATRGACWPSSSGGPQGRRGAPHPPAQHRGAGRGAGAVRVGGLQEAEVMHVGGRRDVWLEKTLSA